MGLLPDWSVQNRPTPRAVRVAVWVAVGAPAFVGGLTALVLLDVVTRKWPSGVPQHVKDRAGVLS
jgi:hypothetical protein